MILSKKNMRGVTLIELMVTLAVLAVILTMAVPSFTKFRERSALRGAADQVASFWNIARFEALKRNERIKVGLIRSDDSTFYLCAAPASSNTDDAAITVANVAQCTYGVYPSEISEWKRMIAPASAGKNGAAFAVIDPKRGSLGDTDQTGFWELRSPAADSDYRLQVNVDLFGRAVVCEPAAATSNMPQFASRQCNN